MYNISTLYSRKTASGEGSKWDVGNIMNDEPIHANSITPDPLSLPHCSPIIEGGKLKGAGINSTNLFGWYFFFIYNHCGYIG